MGAKGSKRNALTIYDVSNKFAANRPEEDVYDDITHVFSEWGLLFVLTGKGHVMQFEEKDMEQKLDILCRRNCYDLAISLCKAQNAEQDMIDVYTQYADHLYRERKYDEAIERYIKTIRPVGGLEPSHVIRKYLDSQRIYNLTAYLEALHANTDADAHHTTLLLNCYTKLKDEQKLDAFVATANINHSIGIKVCRQAKFFRHALQLAESNGEHEMYVKIQLEDMKDYDAALAYIAQLDDVEAEESLKKYGKELVNHLPAKTTALLTKLVTAPRDTDGPMDVDDEFAPVRVRAGPEEFIHIFVNQGTYLLNFLAEIVRLQPDCDGQVYDTLLELYLRADDLAQLPAAEAREERDARVLALLDQPDAKYDSHHAMVLAQMYDFTPGILKLYEKSKRFEQILHYHMEKRAFRQVVECCKQYGPSDKNLWLQSLTYFAQQQDCEEYVNAVLRHVAKHRLFPPLVVIDALARRSTVTIAAVKEYISDLLRAEDQVVQEDRHLIQQYREDTARMRAEITELKTKAKIFKALKCESCRESLTLPAVHFLSGNSYHESCLVSDEDPAIAEDRLKVMDLMQAQGQACADHDQFFKQLDGGRDRFSVVAEYFGRGIFNKVAIVDGTGDRARAAFDTFTHVDTRR